jgi:hypothetical protein
MECAVKPRFLIIDRGSPWQNAWIESFNGRLPDELLNSWQFDSLLEARVIIEDWRCDYNATRPHSAHGELTPTEFAYSGRRPTNPKPHSDWTTKRVPSLFPQPAAQRARPKTGTVSVGCRQSRD